MTGYSVIPQETGNIDEDGRGNKLLDSKGSSTQQRLRSERERKHPRLGRGKPELW